MRPRIICLYLGLFSILGLGKCFEDTVSCEPRHPSYPSTKYWTDRYNMKMDDYGWLKSVRYRSKQTYDDLPLGQLDLSMWNEKVHLYTHVASIHETGKLVLPVKMDQAMIINFYSGHSLRMHILDPQTKTVSHVRLGYHSKQYFFISKPNTYVLMEYEKHLGEKIALLGSTVLRSRTSPKFNFANMSELAREFPDHKDMILGVAMAENLS